MLGAKSTHDHLPHDRAVSARQALDVIRWAHQLAAHWVGERSSLSQSTASCARRLGRKMKSTWDVGNHKLDELYALGPCLPFAAVSAAWACLFVICCGFRHSPAALLLRRSTPPAAPLCLALTAVAPQACRRWPSTVQSASCRGLGRRTWLQNRPAACPPTTRAPSCRAGSPVKRPTIS